MYLLKYVYKRSDCVTIQTLGEEQLYDKTRNFKED